MSQTVKIQFFPLIRQSALIQTGDPDHIPNQTDQSLRFLIDASCKNLHILILHKSVLHDLSKSGNGSQRRFQFMGNIGGKFSSQLFPFYFFGHIHQKDHRTLCLIFSCDRIGDHLNLTAIQTKDLVLMLSFKDLPNDTSKLLRAVQKIYTFSCFDLLYLKKLSHTGVDRKYHGITVDHKKSLLHVLRDNRKFFLLSSGCLKLQTDLPALSADLAEKRLYLIIGIILIRMLQIKPIKRFHNLPGKPGCKYAGQEQHKYQNCNKRRKQLQEQHPYRSLVTGNSQHIAIFKAYCIIHCFFGKRG